MIDRISPAWPAATASGLMIARVRSVAMNLCGPGLLQARFDILADVGGAGADRDSGILQRADFVRRFPRPAGDDRAGMPHAAARRRRLAGNEAHHGLPHVRLNESR